MKVFFYYLFKYKKIIYICIINKQNIINYKFIKRHIMLTVFITIKFAIRFSIDLDKSRELEIGVYWRDWRSLCAIKFLRLEEFIDDIRHGMALQLEPQGLLFAEVIKICVIIIISMIIIRYIKHIEF